MTPLSSTDNSLFVPGNEENPDIFNYDRDMSLMGST